MDMTLEAVLDEVESMSEKDFLEKWHDFYEFHSDECTDVGEKISDIDEFTPENIERFARLCGLSMSDTSHEIFVASQSGRIAPGSRFVIWIADPYEAYRVGNDPAAKRDYIPKAYGFNNPKQVLRIVDEDVCTAFFEFVAGEQR